MARILYVEDETVKRETTAEGLSLKHEVTAVASAGQAIDALHNGTFDLVLTDFNLMRGDPSDHRDGVDIIRHVQEHHSQLPVLLLSTHDLTSMREKVPDFDALEVPLVSKNISLRELNTTIADVLNRQYPQLISREQGEGKGGV